MGNGLRAARASFRLELGQLVASRALIALTVLEAITFLVLVSLFGLTGSKAPTALINDDHGPLATAFVADLAHAHQSFALKTMSRAQANQALARGDLVAIITIPAGFSQAVTAGQTVAVPVEVDNVDADMTDDIERALPSAIEAFGIGQHFPGIRVATTERDLIGHDTGFIPYLVVSALALDALVVAGVLGGVAITREWEAGTIDQLRLAPVGPGFLLAGKLAAAGAVAAVAVGVAAAIVLPSYGIHPANLIATAGALAACVVIFTALGAAIGSFIRRTLPIAPLFFGLAMPLYIDSGALEPQRFDGRVLWALSHVTPVYSAVGVLESAVHGLRVTPESPVQDLVVLALRAVASLLVASAELGRRRSPV
ncbi:MAG: ABC-2 transporter permease [Actinomycetota bacterium]